VTFKNADEKLCDLTNCDGGVTEVHVKQVGPPLPNSSARLPLYTRNSHAHFSRSILSAAPARTGRQAGLPESHPRQKRAGRAPGRSGRARSADDAVVRGKQARRAA
jgi:hypothetical protein